MITTILALLGTLSATMPIPAIEIAEAAQGALPTYTVRETHHVYITAYSSTPDQTDDTPFITATGNTVRPGIVAANFLDFGTKVQIPEFFGETVFVVDDRMHPRKKNFVDVWMPTREEALTFGISYATILVLD